MTKEEKINFAGGKLLRYLGLFQGIFILGFVLSPIIWIWTNWETALKVGLSSIVGILVIYILYNGVKKAISDSIDEIKKNG